MDFGIIKYRRHTHVCKYVTDKSIVPACKIVCCISQIKISLFRLNGPKRTENTKLNGKHDQNVRVSLLLVPFLEEGYACLWVILLVSTPQSFLAGAENCKISVLRIHLSERLEDTGYIYAMEFRRCYRYLLYSSHDKRSKLVSYVLVDFLGSILGSATRKK